MRTSLHVATWMPAETGVRAAAVLGDHDDNDDPRTNRKISPDVCHERLGDIEIGNDAAAAAAWRPPPQRTGSRLVVGLWWGVRRVLILKDLWRS